MLSRECTKESFSLLANLQKSQFLLVSVGLHKVPEPLDHFVAWGVPWMT